VIKIISFIIVNNDSILLTKVILFLIVVRKGQNVLQYDKTHNSNDNGGFGLQLLL